MTKSKILDLENDGLNLRTEGQYLYVRCKRSMYKYSLSDMSEVSQSVIFKKDGKARGLSIHGNYIYLKRFLRPLYS